MSRLLDDQEQMEYIRRWQTNQRKMQAEIRWIRQAHADGAINLVRMEVMIWKTRRKYRRLSR